MLQKFFSSHNDSEILMETACDPEFIIWKNIGFTENQRFVANIRSFAMVLFVIGFTYWSILKFKRFRQDEIGQIMSILGDKGLKGINCQAQLISK
jgi:hypothetical protein